MPRRPLASASQGSSNGVNSSRAHKSSDSHAFVGAIQPLSISSSGALATPQQKMVQVLVNRIKNKLPCYSGVSLDMLEADNAIQQAIEALVDLSHDSLDVIAWALTELLERLAKQTDSSGHPTIEVLQSQLVILKVLSLAMASRWNQNARSSSRASNIQMAPDSPIPSKRSRHTPSEHSSTPPPWVEPPPLDDNCARYILSVMVLFLRQTAPAESPLMFSSRSADPSFNDLDTLNPATLSPAQEAFRGGPAIPPYLAELPGRVLKSKNSATSITSSKHSASSTIPIPAHNFTYEKTHMTLVNSPVSINVLVNKYTGRIVYHLSASNWKVVIHRLRTKIHYLASNSEDKPDTVDLYIMTHCALDRPRILLILSELSSLLINMKKEAQLAVAVPLRIAIWNWIDVFPAEFNEVIRTKGRLEGAPERVFDILYSTNQTGSERQLWPTLVALLAISADRLPSDWDDLTVAATKKEARFLQDVTKNVGTTGRLAEVAIVCALDLCRAATYVHPDGEVTLRLVAYDIAHEVKGVLWSNKSQKPFWDGSEEIDVAIYSEAMATTYRFLQDRDVMDLFVTCMEPERSDAVKSCAVRACSNLMAEAARMPWQKTLEPLEHAMAHRMRSIFKVMGSRRPEQDRYGTSKKASPRPKSKWLTAQTLNDRELLVLAILSLGRANPAFFFDGLETNDIDDWMKTAIKLWEGPMDNTVKISTASSLKLLSDIIFAMHPSEPHFDSVVPWMKRAFPITLVCVATRLIHTRLDSETQRLWIGMTHQVLEMYVKKSDAAHMKDIQLSEDRINAFVLGEIASLITLTSADNSISQLAGSCLRLIAQANRQEGAPMSPSDEEGSKRNPIYEQLGDPHVAVVGRLGHQKRIRKLIRLIAFPSSLNAAVWEECYWRWRHLSDILVQEASTSVDDKLSQRTVMGSSLQQKQFQWQNLTLFLAAFGGVCIPDDREMTPLTNIVPPEYLPDSMRVMKKPADLVEVFLTELINLLVADNLQLREISRDALGAELNPRLFSRLLKHLDEVIREITRGAGTQLTDNFTLFLDQFIAVLKLLVENGQIPGEEVLTADVSSTLLAIATFVTRFSLPASARIRIKFCALCDSVSDRTDALTFRKDSVSRHNILDIIMEWIQPPADTNEELAVAQNDVNMPALRTVVKLLDRLQLRPLDGSSGDDSIHAVSRLFIRYSKILLRGLELCKLEIPASERTTEAALAQQTAKASQREAELRELVITGLAHLVSANTESGFKQCLPLAYEQDVQKRTIFAHVFARVLGQGTKFDPQDRSVTLARQAQLLELVKAPDMEIAMAICETCPPGEVDIIISVLLNIFDTRESLIRLLKLMIDREIARTENEASLFRGNSTCTRFLSAFAKIHGYNYLRSLIVPLIKTMSSIPPGQGYELDPNKAGDQDVTQNQRNVQLVASSFLDIVTSSINTLPSMFREICAHIGKSVHDVWPDHKFVALGAFIFLRFISPAVVAPESVDVEIPKDEDHIIRRGLMVVAKVIQNLANNIYFGKEAHMVALNDFLKVNIANVTRYLSEVNKYVANKSTEEADEWLGTTSDDTDIIVLHRFFQKHNDKIGQELLSHVKPTDGDDSTASGKSSWDALCGVLVDLGAALEVPRLSAYTRAEHRDYCDLMARYAHRNTDAVQQFFIETEPPTQDKPALFILRISQIEAEALDIELLMYHIFKTLASPIYNNRMFEVVLDCTAFSPMSEVPLQWLKYCAELIPSDIRDCFLTTHILNPNRLAQRYMRRLYNISAGTRFCGEIRAYPSVRDLLEHVSISAIPGLKFPTDLEREPRECYDEVTMRLVHQMRMPVILEVGATHIRITTVKAQTISPVLSCRAVEIIPLADISDIYNVSVGHEPYEFIIRRSRQGITLYFSSAARDTIIKSIRMAKGQLKETPAPLASKFARFSNVPATLLHVGMLGMVSADLKDEESRGAAYDLLGAVCSYLKYDKSPIVAAKAGIVPGDPSIFIIQLSERLAEFVPELTLDFISEASAGISNMEPNEISQRINCLQYMSPWIKNFAHFTNSTNPLYERSAARLRDCIRTLIDLSMSNPEITASVQKYIWAEVGKLDSVLVNVILDELIRTASDSTMGSPRGETIARMVASLTSINVRGKLFSRLRKSLGKGSTKAFKLLDGSPHWNETATLIRLSFVSAYHSKQPTHNQLYLPEIVHLVSLLAGVGAPLVRKSVYGIVMNVLQSLHLARSDEDADTDLLGLINECSSPETLQLFGLERATPTVEYSNYDPVNDKAYIDNHEALTRLLYRVLSATAGSTGLLNVWRVRWMSLVTSTAFQLVPAIQGRSFIVLGTLATSDVDDDFLYQMFVAFKTALAQSSEVETLNVVAMLRCMCNIVPALTEDSKWLSHFFWLAVALLQSSHIGFYIEATNLLRVTLDTLDSYGAFKEASVSTVLLDSRVPIEETASQLDRLLGLSFESNFSFSLAAIIFKGIRHAPLRESADNVLRSLLRATVKSYQADDEANGFEQTLCPDALGYFAALIPLSTTPASYQRLLADCQPDETAPLAELELHNGVPRVSISYLGVLDPNSALLIASFLATMINSAQGDDAETEMLYCLLSEVSGLFPDTVSMIYESLQDRVKDTFANSSNPAIIKAVSTIIRGALIDTTRMSSLRGSATTLSTLDEAASYSAGQTQLLALEDLGMQGLANSFQFLPMNRGHATTVIQFISELVGRMIE